MSGSQNPVADDPDYMEIDTEDIPKDTQEDTSKDTQKDSPEKMQQKEQLPIVLDDPTGRWEGLIKFEYPRLPVGIDFETYRKTDKMWMGIIEAFNRKRRGDGEDEEVPIHKKRERFIAANWPRNPEGPDMISTPDGKSTPNGCMLWGATLYDFYRMRRIPKNIHLVTTSSGSKLAAWMKEIGELDWAQSQLAQAEKEDMPYEILPYDISKLIEIFEDQIRKGRFGKSLKVDRESTETVPSLLYPPCEYPAPWPLKPFSTPTPHLQRSLNFALLPKRLFVHDPYRILAVSNKTAKYFPRIEYGEYREPRTDPQTCKWPYSSQNIYTYNLKLTKEAKESAKKSHPGFECDVAHLYVTPKRCIGSGHHSYVLQVELELPREVIMPARMCADCTKERLEKGKFRPDQGSNLNEDFVKFCYSALFKNGKPFEEADRKNTQFTMLQQTNIQHKPPYCQHIIGDGPQPPPSVRVSMIAKLAFPDDEDSEPHHQFLHQEAENYQNFPDHIFQHWNGYNIIPPVHDPTPVGAVAPNFYGFYVPDESNLPIKNGEYMSPILLLEHCGTQAKFSELSLDDRRECFSLLRRLHAIDYFHGSVYQRNIMMQHGPLQFSPLVRNSTHLRFRLVDFGRTEKGATFHKQTEEYGKANDQLGLQMY